MVEIQLLTKKKGSRWNSYYSEEKTERETKRCFFLVMASLLWFTVNEKKKQTLI
ncbi:hypothetical protein WN48_08167 [Eufriesea mexicana]|uniref:Uncharacterized protein n=1 Tax=Eufriesea mexicana TaxID=516756 RepID=A0A310SAZ7_9HYME|nr:hypothetical protein WN48_08167 [Eufriesea mexicana]